MLGLLTPNKSHKETQKLFENSLQINQIILVSHSVLKTYKFPMDKLNTKLQVSLEILLFKKRQKNRTNPPTTANHPAGDPDSYRLQLTDSDVNSLCQLA